MHVMVVIRVVSFLLVVALVVALVQAPIRAFTFLLIISLLLFVMFQNRLLLRRERRERFPSRTRGGGTLSRCTFPGGSSGRRRRLELLPQPRCLLRLARKLLAALPRELLSLRRPLTEANRLVLVGHIFSSRFLFSSLYSSRREPCSSSTPLRTRATAKDRGRCRCSFNPLPRAAKFPILVWTTFINPSDDSVFFNTRPEKILRPG